MSVLSDELSKPEYAGLSDQAAADAVNAKTVVVNQLVPIWQVKEHAILNGYWPMVKAGQLDANPTKAGLCVSVIDWIDDPKLSTIDVNLPEVQTMLGGLVSFSLLTQSQANEVVAMGTKVVSWTSTVGLPEVGIGLVQNARKEMGVNL
jgi:hypothetical protein